MNNIISKLKLSLNIPWKRVLKIFLSSLLLIIIGLTYYITIKPQVYKESNTQKVSMNVNKKTSPHNSNISDEMTATEYEKIKNQLIDTVNKKDPKAALADLQTLTNIDPKVIKYCHGLTHEIGHAAYKKYGFIQALTYLDDLCGSGYIHGVIESDFSGTTDLTSKLHMICQTATLSSQSGNCYHGVGHGLMFYTNNDIPLSLSYCDVYTDVTQRSLCSEGVFMENFNSDTLFHPTKYLNPNDPFYPCPLQTPFYKDACYFYATDYYLHLHDGDYIGAITWCNGAEKGYVQTCDRGVGSRAMKYNSGAPKFVEKVCMSTNSSENQAACIDGMISYFLVQYDSTSRAKTLCAELSATNQAACLQGINNRSQHFLN